MPRVGSSRRITFGPRDTQRAISAFLLIAAGKAADPLLRRCPSRRGVDAACEALHWRAPCPAVRRDAVEIAEREIIGDRTATGSAPLRFPVLRHEHDAAADRVAGS